MVRLRTISIPAAALLAAACGNNSPPSPPTSDIPPNCQRPVATSATQSQVLLHESGHKTGDVVSFNVPAGTGSVTILHQAQTANLRIVYQGQVMDNSAVPGQIFKPDGAKVYDDNDSAHYSVPSSPDGGTDPSGLYAFYGGGTPSTAAFTMPNTANSLDAGVPSGTWKFVVNDYAYECATQSGCSDGGALGNTYDVTVTANPAPAPTAKANLDLAFYIVASVTNPRTGLPLNAVNAPNDPSIKRMVSTFQNIYSQVGINVTTPVFYDVAPAAVTRFGTNINADLTGPCDELNQMFLLSADHPGNTLNLFLVQTITSKSNGGGQVVGIDGTIPGPAGFAGTVHSGAAVSLADLYVGSINCGGAINLNCGADVVAYIGAHEAGHFLGMFHTTESAGADFDPVTDTPKCPCTQCASSADLPRCGNSTSSNPIFLSASQCVNAPTCGGGDNLMFWQLSSGYSQGTLTPQQGAIMRLNPAVHP